ncbi:4-hydroxy-tetrahydrodipicolinate reductase [Devosia sp. 1566]|uniref:4-hydroxy-tetrahydrodipicolinate reductase n=1 Tax=Devosia sp. 1566 TaxID=2499144 RepID=UPI000FDA383F|nr:4-hydroxy-tetrahydrodipicolinate reductase [Devosia sp. 1566]
MTIRVALAGATGKVGKALAVAIARAEDLTLTGAVARSSAGQDLSALIGAGPSLTIAATLAEALDTPSDVVVDYTKPQAVKAHALMALAAGRHLVIGTSGLSADDFEEIAASAEAQGRGVLAAGNFSITATLLRRFALDAARYVPDVEIIDYGPGAKTDVPSGTAREMAEFLAPIRGAGTVVAVDKLTGLPATRGASIGSPHAVQVHSVRVPSYALSCEVIFGADNERLTLRHDAGAAPAPYVAGTLLAIRKVGSFSGLRRGLDSILD